METDTTTALLRSVATERDPKRLGVIRRLLAWFRKQLGRLRDFFFRRKKPVSKTFEDDYDHSDNETVAVSVCELPEQAMSRPLVAAAATKAAPELTPEPMAKKAIPILSVAEPLNKDALPPLKPMTPPRTMEEAMEVNKAKKSNTRRASLPAYFATTATKKEPQPSSKGKAAKSRRASYAVGTSAAAPLPPKPLTPPSKAIQWVQSAPAQLKKTEAAKAMLDGSLERSITRINEEEDPRIAWEKPEWAKDNSGRSSLRKSFSHNLW